VNERDTDLREFYLKTGVRNLPDRAPTPTKVVCGVEKPGFPFLAAPKPDPLPQEEAPDDLARRGVLDLPQVPRDLCTSKEQTSIAPLGESHNRKQGSEYHPPASNPFQALRRRSSSYSSTTAGNGTPGRPQDRVCQNGHGKVWCYSRSPC
jgi:hypothetical protein